MYRARRSRPLYEDRLPDPEYGMGNYLRPSFYDSDRTHVYRPRRK